MTQCMSLHPLQHQLNHCLILGFHPKAGGLAKFWKHCKKKKDSVIIYLLWKSYACTAGLQNELEEYRQTACDLHFAQNKWCLSIVKSVTWWLIKLIVFDLVFLVINITPPWQACVITIHVIWLVNLLAHLLQFIMTQ